LRKLLAAHVFTTRRPNIDRFHEEQYKVRRDFDKIYNSRDLREIECMLEKYELFIEKNFEPYSAMHESRPHSNLWGKLLIYNQTALNTDHIGFYKPVLMHGEPTSVHFHEQYPHMVTGWMYDHKYLSDDFNYEDVEGKYLDQAAKESTRGTSSSDSLRQQLDQAHKM
jgi:hypothetical protein